jgi:hypothetical protein
MAIGQDKIKQIKELEKQKILQPILEDEGENLRELVTGDFKKGDRLLSYRELARLQTWLLKRFDYVSDGWQFNKNDMWDTTAWKRAMVCHIGLIKGDNGKFQGDCDDFGYAMLGILYYVFGYTKSQLERVACKTETGEGHFITWIQANDNVIYQMENRVRKPRSVKYMRDLGYEYWHYSKMTNVDKWFNAEKRASRIIYDTPANLESDKPEFSLAKALRIDKSKTLLKDWIQTIVGLFIGIKTAILSAPNEVADILSANKSDLTNIVSNEVLGFTIAVLGFIGIYLRTITNKDVDHKKGLNE